MTELAAICHARFQRGSYSVSMRGAESSSDLQQRAEATVDHTAGTLRAALTAGEHDLELQMLTLAGMAGEYGRTLLITMASRALMACSWPQITPRPRQAPSRLEMLGQSQDGDLTIWLELLPPNLLRLRLTHRDTLLPHDEPLYSVDIEMDPELWRQLRKAR